MKRPETTAEMWARWQRESETRLALFNASLPSRDDGLQPGIGGFGLSWQDKANRSSDGRY